MKINMCGEKNTGKKSELIIIKNFYRLYKQQSQGDSWVEW